MQLKTELDALGGALDALDGFWRQRLQAGVRLPQVEAMFADLLPWRPTLEVAQLYEWANGQIRGSMDIFPGHAFLPLDSAMRRLRQMSHVHQPAPPVLPVFGGISLVVPLSRQHQAEAPVYWRSEHGLLRAYDSLSHFVRTWREALHAGIVRWTGSGWQVDWRRLDGLRAIINPLSYAGHLPDWAGDPIPEQALLLQQPERWPAGWDGFAPHFPADTEAPEEILPVVLRPEFSGEAEAEHLLLRYRAQFPADVEYLLVNARDFAQLDLKWYDQTRNELEKLGFRMVADVEDVRHSQRQPELLPVLVRILSAPDRLSNVLLYQHKPRTTGKLAGLLRRRWPGTVVFETHFDDCAVKTYRSHPADFFGAPPQVSAEILPDVGLEQAWVRHQERGLRLRKERSGIKPQLLRGFETIRSAHSRETAWGHQFATTRIPGFEELRQLGVAAKDLQRVHDLVALVAGRISPTPA